MIYTPRTAIIIIYACTRGKRAQKSRRVIVNNNNNTSDNRPAAVFYLSILVRFVRARWSNVLRKLYTVIIKGEVSGNDRSILNTATDVVTGRLVGQCRRESRAKLRPVTSPSDRGNYRNVFFFFIRKTFPPSKVNRRPNLSRGDCVTANKSNVYIAIHDYVRITDIFKNISSARVFRNTGQFRVRDCVKRITWSRALEVYNRLVVGSTRFQKKQNRNEPA